MKHSYLKLAALFLFMSGCSDGPSYGQSMLKLENEIMLPGVKGRIDHMDINLQDQVVYVAALGNNSLEVVDLKKGKVLHEITGLSEPQGVGYVPKHHEIFVANGGTGECVFYDATTYRKVSSVKYDDDADDVRYDSAGDRLYVGYGSGGIGIVDAATHTKIGDIKLPAHPESFQLDTRERRLWVNLPGSGEVAMADLQNKKLIAQWKRLLPRANFPMAYDSVQHRLMIGYRIPATLKVIDSRTGKELFSQRMVGDVDDFYWDDRTRQLLVSGGGGAVNIFRQEGQSFTRVANIPTRNGARTSFWVPQLRLFILAARDTGGKPAALLIYRIAE